MRLVAVRAQLGGENGMGFRFESGPPPSNLDAKKRPLTEVRGRSMPSSGSRARAYRSRAGRVRFNSPGVTRRYSVGMSIWSSVHLEQEPPASVDPMDWRGPDVLAADLHAESTDEYKATGDANLTIDVATATPWNDRIRLAVFPAADSDAAFDVCLLLDRANAALLRDSLSSAIDEVNARYPD